MIEPGRPGRGSPEPAAGPRPGPMARGAAARRWVVDVGLAVLVTAADVGGSYAAGSWHTHHLHQAPPGMLAYALLAAGAPRWPSAAATR
jgi:hypothetical protein